MNQLWDRLKRMARLGGIVALATANLALSYCSSTQTKIDSAPRDTTAPTDSAEQDAGPPDAAPAKPDAKLWDVLCE